MRIPAVVKSEITYFILICWKTGAHWGEDVNRAYKTMAGAERAARRLLETGIYSAVTIRRENVWKRDALNEFSSSSPVCTLEA